MKVGGPIIVEIEPGSEFDAAIRKIIREELEAFFSARSDRMSDERVRQAFDDEFLPAMDAYLERRRNG